MSLIRYVVGNLIAGMLRPVVWGAFALFAIWFVITVPARLWVLYVDRQASAGTIAMLEWGTGALLAEAWVVWMLRARAQSSSRRRRGSA